MKKFASFWDWFDHIKWVAARSRVGLIAIQNGFDVWHTGGGCLAWGKNGPDEHYAMITTVDGTELGEHMRNPERKNFIVGLYNKDDDFVCPEQSFGFSEAVAWCDRALADPSAMFAKEGA